MPKKITLKLILSIILSGTFVLLLIVVYTYKISSKIIKKQIRDNAENLTLSVVNKIDTVLLPIQKIPDSLAIFLENSKYSKEDLIKIMKLYVQKNPDIYGCAIAFEPYKFNKNKKYFSIYAYKHNNKILTRSIPYKYVYWDWYQLPKELNRAVWTEPYYGKSGNIIMTTFSAPFYKIVNGKKEFWGVATADVSLDWLQNIISSIKIAKSGYAFLISKDGRFVTYPKKDFIMNETIFTVAEEYNLPYLRKIGLNMIHGKRGFVQITSILTHKKCWLSFAPISANGWSVGVVFPKKELMASINYLDTYITIIGLLGMILLFIITTLISTSITKPLIALTRLTKHVAKGNLDVDIPYINLKDEVGDLARSFAFMKNSLKEYIENLKETTAAKERIQSELNIAAKIQSSMLPQNFPPFPDRKEFEIYAVMKPAKEVGGDFYDFFFVDKNKLCFTICDVSGKGVPASLFMAILKYLLKTVATKTKSPADIIKSANKILIPDNKTCMFATGFLGILNTDNGIVEFANAGHLPPILYKNGKASFVKTHENFVIGVFENVEYKNQEIQLERNDILLLYSDGATEAKNSKNDMLTSAIFIKKVEEFLQKNDNIVDLVNHLQSEIESFSKDVPQSDDITLLAIKFKGT